MKNFYYKYKGHILTFIFSLLFGVGIFCLYFFLKEQTMKDAIDACSVSCVSLIGIGLLVIITRLGAFDTFIFGFKQMVTSMFSKDPNVYNSMADYKLAKYDERKKKKMTYLMFFLAGFIFLIGLIVLEIIFHIFYR